VRLPFVILLVAPAALGGLAYASSTMRVQPRFAMTVSPAVQTAVRGATISHSIDVRRSDAKRVRLTVARLPAEVRAHWQLPSRAVTSAPALTRDGAILRLRASARATLGTRRLDVRATAGGRILRRSLWLTVARAGGRRFSVTVSPARQVVPRGSIARFRVRVSRAPRVRLRVRLRVRGLPRGERGRFANGTLAISTSDAQPTGRHRLVVSATAWVGASRVRSYAVVTLLVAAPRRLAISGDLPTLLFPGADAPLDVTLINPHAFGLRLRTLRVRVRAQTSEPGCHGAGDYAVRQYGGGYPLMLRPGRTRLSALVADRALWPRISMRNLPVDQEACKGAVLRLDYSGVATR